MSFHVFSLLKRKKIIFNGFSISEHQVNKNLAFFPDTKGFLAHLEETREPVTNIDI